MKNTVTIEDNEIFQANPTYSYQDYKTLLKDWIIDDYSKGIRTAKISIFPQDLEYNDGTLAKEWYKGEIVEINDVVNVLNKDGNSYLLDFYGNPVYFRVTGRNVKYEGQVIIDLELQEIKN